MSPAASTRKRMARFDACLSQIDGRTSNSIRVMANRWLAIATAILAAFIGEGPVALQAEGPYARIAFLRPHDGDTVDFEAGYLRHLEFHRQAKDAWVWYGWSIWAGDRQRWFVYATFGHSAASLDNPVPPAEDERDNVANVTPHASFVGNALYEFLPAPSRGTGVPTPTARVEMATIELNVGTTKAFEAALSSSQPSLKGETLWFRMVAGGAAPRYLRLRPRPTLAAILEDRDEQALPVIANDLIAKATIEILNLQPTMSYGVTPAR
jgi:hypothetical protein